MNEIQELENYLLRGAAPEELLLTEARLLLNPGLRDTAKWQKETYALIQQYGRKKIKSEIEAVHTRLFSEKKFETFSQRILSIFKRRL